jgi:hypothetical protein
MVRSIDMSDDAIERWFGSFATRLKPGHTIEPPRRPPTEKAIVGRLSKGDTVIRTEEGRWAFLPRPHGDLLLFVGGEEMHVPAVAAPLARMLCATRRYDGRVLKAELGNATARALLVRLFANGALRF